MKHFFLILLIIVIILTGIFLPYIPGDYDYFAVGLSYIFQFASFASLLLVPVGLIWFLMDFTYRRKSSETVLYPVYLRKIALIVMVVVVLAAALGAFASNNRFSAIIILCVGIYFLFTNRKKAKIRFSQHIMAYYFFFIPLTVVFIRLTFLEKIKNNSTDFAIRQCELLIQDIESYKSTNGHYPVSLLSTIEDYKPLISGIPGFHYELKGNAYNIYFEQISNMLGTEEIVMYNKLDEQEMTVHNQDLVRIRYNNIIHGHHKVVQIPNQHWKIFYFD
jgi:hypothetical protein